MQSENACCIGCGERLCRSALAQGKAVRLGHRVVCSTCLPPYPRRDPRRSDRHVGVRQKTQRGRAGVVCASWIGLVAAVVVLAAQWFGREAAPAPRELQPESKPAGTPDPVPALYLAARAYASAYPQDVDRIVELYRQALRDARPASYEEIRRELRSFERASATRMALSLEQLDAQLRQLARIHKPDAMRAILRMERQRYVDPSWSLQIDRRLALSVHANAGTDPAQRSLGESTRTSR
ncbi:MAG TPA: hypothetical protein VI643_00930 [Planctomycetota bacterium]|nr:hypothetical protein [Planctomycetota bacterium]